MKKGSVLSVILVFAALAPLTLRPQLQAQKTQVPPEFEVVSTKRVASAESTFNRMSFMQNETGLVVILKRALAKDGITVHSNDFVLSFESDTDIPRRPCVGISYGMKSPDDEVRWGAGPSGNILRYGIGPGEPYFALLFPAPKNVSTFSLYRAVPYSRPFTVKP